jgi:hypothetical protein
VLLNRQGWRLGLEKFYIESGSIQAVELKSRGDKRLLNGEGKGRLGEGESISMN